MGRDRLRRALRANALFDLLVGLVLLSASWDRLYRWLDLPPARPEMFPQVAGAALLGFAYLLWVSARDPGLARPAALAAAWTNALSAVVIAVWLGVGTLGVGLPGAVLLAVVAGILAAFALAELGLVGGPRRPSADRGIRARP